MNPRNDTDAGDAGYGNSSLVGSDRAGLASALEARDAVRRAADEANAARDDEADRGRDAGSAAATRTNDAGTTRPDAGGASR